MAGVIVSGIATPEVTGAFEVVGDDGTTFHSKLQGQGYLDDDNKKLTAVVNAVKEVLATRAARAAAAASAAAAATSKG